MQSTSQDWQKLRDSGILPPIDTMLSKNGQVLAKLERMNLVLNTITNSSEQRFDTRAIELELRNETTEEIKIIKSSLQNPTALNLHNLELFQVTFQDIFMDLKDWRSNLQIITGN